MLHTGALLVLLGVAAFVVAHDPLAAASGVALLAAGLLMVGSSRSVAP